MPEVDIAMTFLARSNHSLADPADDVMGLAVVDPNGLRLGTVEDLVIDTVERRVRLLSVVSGGVLGLAATRTLLPVEVVTKVDHRVHVDRTRENVHGLAERQADRQASPRRRYRSVDAEHQSFADVYERFGVDPFRTANREALVYFHSR